MNTLFFKYALEVEKTRSITQAAENMYMGQPNLSKAIKEAEETLGYEIFNRTSKGVFPTAKGAQFLTYAREIVQQMERMEAIRDTGAEDVQQLNLSMPRGTYISRALIQFAQTLDQNSRIRLNVLETGSMQTISSVAEGKFDLGIIRYQTTYEQYFRDFLAEKNLCSDLVWMFSYVVLMSRKHVLAGRDVIRPADLRNATEIVHGDTAVPYFSPEKNGVEGVENKPRVITLYERTNQFELLSNVHSTFMWVSPIPQDTLDRYDLVQRKCDFPTNTYKDVLIYQKGYAFTPLDRRFIDLVYESKNEVSLRTYH